jgi:hypothetical protein
MYDLNTLVIAGLLLPAMLAGMALGRLSVRRRVAGAPPEVGDQAKAVQASLLGLMALLLGFSFSLALTRHDDRARAVVDEANAIGTAWLRVDLLDVAAQDPVRAALRAYVGARLRAAEVSLDRSGERAGARTEADRAFAALWVLAAEAARTRPTPAHVALATALTEMYDAFGDRLAAQERHVPELVMGLLFVTLVLLGFVLGYVSRITGVRPSAPMLVMVVLILTMVALILDLDRPRRGLIRVDQSALFAVGAAVVP